MKWLKPTLLVLLALGLLAAAAYAGFHYGSLNAATLARPAKSQAQPGDQQAPQLIDPHECAGMNPHGMGGFEDRDFHGWSHFDRTAAPFHFLPFFGLIRLLVLGGLVWLGVVLYRRSGWRLSLNKVAPPAETSSPAAQEDEPKS